MERIDTQARINSQASINIQARINIQASINTKARINTKAEQLRSSNSSLLFRLILCLSHIKGAPFITAAPADAQNLGKRSALWCWRLGK